VTTRVVIAVALALLAALMLMREIGGGAPPPLSPPRPRAARPVRVGGAPPAVSSRNVFEYGALPTAEPKPRPATPVAAGPPPVVAPVAAPPVRLVGLVRRGGVLKAALRVHGETMVVGAGEAAGDYRVVAVDEDAVRLRAADGTTITLPAGDVSVP
jgi:hypothetical protein